MTVSIRQFLWAPLWVLTVGLLCGCHLGGRPIQPCPLTYAEQSRDILRIVPLGTARDEAIAKLRAAGIGSSPGTNESIYYCDVWNRPEGERWFINIALMFDEQGNLYEARPADAEVWPDQKPPSTTSPTQPANQPSLPGV